MKAFHHFSLGGELNVEEEETLERVVERVVCRWCGSSDAITEEPLLYAAPEDQGPGSESA
ncbi:MAG TPA: hypothetical protein VHJ82_07950 [Actinomycetota bacterium]|nr:hypothetical protein [Actinomycetota bacterium]